MSIARSHVDSELSRGSPPGDLYRDRKATALEAAEHLERKHPNSDTVVTDAAGRSRTSPTRAALTNRTCRSFSRLRPVSLVLTVRSSPPLVHGVARLKQAKL